MPIGFKRSKQRKNVRKHANHNKEDKGKRYVSSSYCTSSYHDHTKHGKIRKHDVARREARDFKNDA